MTTNTIKSTVTVLSLTVIFTLFSGFTGFDDRYVTVSKKDLPKKAQTFINEYFSDYYFLRATESANYSVMFKGSTQIEFSRDGNWMYVSGHGSEIPTAFIDTKVLNTVESKYGEYSIIAIEKTKKHYNVTLNDDTKLKIDTEGNVLKETIRN